VYSADTVEATGFELRATVKGDRLPATGYRGDQLPATECAIKILYGLLSSSL